MLVKKHSTSTTIKLNTKTFYNVCNVKKKKIFIEIIFKNKILNFFQIIILINKKEQN